MKPSEILAAAKQLISNPEQWTTGALARNKIQSPVLPVSGFACCWCAVGAILKVIGPRWDSEAESEKALVWLRKATKQFGFSGTIGTPATMNDKKTHGDVMALYDVAIALAEENGS